MKINIKELGLTISAKKGVVSQASWDSNTDRYQFDLIVSNGKQRTKFKFYDSVLNFRNGIDELDHNALISAFGCVMSDASIKFSCSGLNDFISDFGYTDYEQAIRTYNACLMSAKKLSRVLRTDDLETAYNVFAENYDQYR